MTPIKLSLDFQRQEVINHLLSLDKEDLRLRFGYTPTDSTIEKYVSDSWKRPTDRWFGIYHKDYDGLVGTLHIAQMSSDTAEFGCTVHKALRGNGYGDVLFRRGAVWAKAHAIKHIFMHCLSENKVVQHIAKKHEMNVIRMEGGEAEADLVLSTDYSAPMSEAIMSHIAIYDMLLVNRQKLLQTLFRK